MNWVVANLPILLSSGSILIVLFVLKRALDWAEWKGTADRSLRSIEGSVKEIKDDIRAIQEDIKKIFNSLPNDPS